MAALCYVERTAATAQLSMAGHMVMVDGEAMADGVTSLSRVPSLI